jgi:hypothetical protein
MGESNCLLQLCRHLKLLLLENLAVLFRSFNGMGTILLLQKGNPSTSCSLAYLSYCCLVGFRPNPTIPHLHCHIQLCRVVLPLHHPRRLVAAYCTSYTTLPSHARCNINPMHSRDWQVCSVLQRCHALAITPVVPCSHGYAWVIPGGLHNTQSLNGLMLHFKGTLNLLPHEQWYLSRVCWNSYVPCSLETQ